MVSTHSYVRGLLLSNISDLWSYQLYGQFLDGPTADHLSDIDCFQFSINYWELISRSTTCARPGAAGGPSSAPRARASTSGRWCATTSGAWSAPRQESSSTRTSSSTRSRSGPPARPGRVSWARYSSLQIYL